MAAPIWQEIDAALSAEIESGRFASGARLPTESALAQRFGVNRHTVRRAVAAMRDRGLVYSRRGAGVFVTASPVPYRLGAKTRFTQTLAEAGHTGSRIVLRAETVPATASEAEMLALPDGAEVHIVETVGLIDDIPATHTRSAFPAHRLDGFIGALQATRSVTAALTACGVEDYQRDHTRISAERASSTTARHLEIADGAPVIRAVALNRSADGTPIEFGRTLFSADRIELLVEATPTS